MRDWRFIQPSFQCPTPRKNWAPKKTEAQNLPNRLENHQGWVLACLHDFQVPSPTTWQNRIPRDQSEAKSLWLFSNFRRCETFCHNPLLNSNGTQAGPVNFAGPKAGIAKNLLIPLLFSVIPGSVSQAYRGIKRLLSSPNLT